VIRARQSFLSASAPRCHISTAQNGVWGNTSAYNWPDETGPMGPYQEQGLYGMIKNDMITPK